MRSSFKNLNNGDSPAHPLTLALVAALCAVSAQAQTEGAVAAVAAPAPTTQPAQQPTEQLQRVEVSGTPSDDAKRRASSASKIIIGREEIERFGDSSLGEVLKRLPGVTTGGRPGRGGDIRMRGMGSGYTQILVNGERMSPGFSLDQLPPDQVERIEVMRAPTAEFGARAVAGTINVVLREALAKRLNDWRFGLSSERGLLRPSIGWTRNDKLDDAGGAYNLTVNAQQSDRLDDINSRTLTRNLPTQTDSLLTTTGQNAEQRASINLNLRLQWRQGDGDSFSIQPFLVASKGNTDSRFVQLNDPVPDPLPPNYFDRAQSLGDSKFSMLRVNSQWQRRLDENTRLELRGGVGTGASDSHSVRQEYRTGSPQPNRVQDDRSSNREKSWNLHGKYSRQLENEHSLVGGLEGEGTQRDQSRVCLQNGLTCRGLLEFGDDLSAATQRLAAYAQDEWAVGKQWSFYAGLRAETIATRSQAANYSVSNRASVWTPLLHSVWKFDEKSRDQIRASLTRSYRSPNLQDLIAQPTINSQYPCPDAQPCGPTRSTTPTAAATRICGPNSPPASTWPMKIT